MALSLDGGPFGTVHPMRRVPLLILVLVAAAVSSALAIAGDGNRVETQFRSVALADGVRATVVLPPGYGNSARRYPVVYFLHGLPATAGAHEDVAWLAEALRLSGSPAILVAPQGARDGDSDPEYLDWGPGRNWETYVANEVPRLIDARFRTIRSRAGRALIGLSAGGYGAAIVGIHHLGTFSVVESWSGYFHPTDPTGTKPLARGAGATAHTFVPRLRDEFRRAPTFLAFYVGSDDRRFRPENEQLDRELTQARVPHVFRVYRGGHARDIWEAHAPEWFRLALTHLAPARP
jgi:enterochelin esterase-like enzyme